MTERTAIRNADKAGIRPHDWLNVRREELEKKTHVKWSISHAHGGYAFDPIDEGVSAGPVSDEVIDSILWAHGKAESDGFSGYVRYLSVYQEIGYLPLSMIMRAVKWLEKKGRVRRTVNRMGKGYAFKLV